jgi:uracil-DNA glycosylase family 4
MTKEIRGASCSQCPLQDDKYTLVVSKGPRQPQFIVVGEGPGMTEAHEQQNFVGQSGQLLRTTLQQCGVDPNQGYYANATLCWPRTILDKEQILGQAIQACSGHLRGLLNALPNVPVLAMGVWAQRALGLSVAERWERDKISGKWAIATHHPARVLREPGLMFQFKQAISKFTTGPAIPQPEYPGAMAYTENPYPLPDLNGWGGQRICLDIETDQGVEWRNPDNHIFLLGIGISAARYIFTDTYLAQPETQAWLRALVVQHGANIGGHNYKFDSLCLARQFGTPLTVGWDTILMVNTYHEYWHKSLKALATHFYNADDYEHRLVKSYLARFKLVRDRTYNRVPKPQMVEYLLNDVGYNLWLADDLERLLKEAGRWEMPYLAHELPQINMLAQVEWSGFPIDLAKVQQEQAAMISDINLVQEQVTQLTQGVITKPGSILQIRKYLYDTLARPVKNHTPTGAPSTDEATLLDHKGDEGIQALLYYRRLTKLKNSYLDNLTKFVYPDKYGVNRVHTTYKAHNVVTHRLSATNPAVQTIPNQSVRDQPPAAVLTGINELHGEVDVGGDYGTRIKQCYVPRPGCVLLTMDGAGWEVATACLQSGDKVLADAFNRGESPHNQVCRMLYGSQYTKEQKVKEKNIFFGWMYGGSVYALVQETHLPEKDVTEVMEFLAANLLGLKEWRVRMIEGAKSGGNVVPYFNYKNHFDLITPTNRREVEKYAVNYINQGLGSMIMCRVAYLAWAKLQEINAPIVALVHDDFTVDVPDQYVGQAARIMADTLATVGQEITDLIPLAGEFKVGRTWGTLKDISLQELEANYV